MYVSMSWTRPWQVTTTTCPYQKLSRLHLSHPKNLWPVHLLCNNPKRSNRTARVKGGWPSQPPTSFSNVTSLHSTMDTCDNFKVQLFSHHRGSSAFRCYHKVTSPWFWFKLQKHLCKFTRILWFAFINFLIYQVPWPKMKLPIRVPWSKVNVRDPKPCQPFDSFHSSYEPPWSWATRVNQILSLKTIYSFEFKFEYFCRFNLCDS